MPPLCCNSMRTSGVPMLFIFVIVFAVYFLEVLACILFVSPFIQYLLERELYYRFIILFVAMSSAESTKHAKKTQGKNIVDLILEDHTKVKTLYKTIQGDKEKHKEKLYEEMMWSIAQHAVAEELV